jgi:hypothetical protein
MPDGPGQIEGNRCAATRLAFDRKRAAGALSEIPDPGKTEPGAAPWPFGREEWPTRLGHDMLCHPRSGVDGAERHEVAGQPSDLPAKRDVGARNVQRDGKVLLGVSDVKDRYFLCPCLGWRPGVR